MWSGKIVKFINNKLFYFTQQFVEAIVSNCEFENKVVSKRSNVRDGGRLADRRICAQNHRLIACFVQNNNLTVDQYIS